MSGSKRQSTANLPLEKVLQLDEEEFEQHLQDILEEGNKNDFLGKAAEAEADALIAIEAKKYDEAWRLFHEQKMQYIKHASRSGFTRLQTLALDGSVSEYLANILRLEGKHLDALTHIVYWVASSSRKTKKQKQKLVAYFNRAGLAALDLSTVEGFIEGIKQNPEYPLIQTQMKAWK
jgi:hypothetical protein